VSVDLHGAKLTAGTAPSADATSGAPGVADGGRPGLAEGSRVTGADVACRALDVSLAVALLVVLSPLMTLIALLIRLESPGPALFRQRRVGRGQMPFTVQKFRTMRTDSGDDAHREFVLRQIAGERASGSSDAPSDTSVAPRFKLVADDRWTRAGRWLRRSSLDELPQLWNVVRGDMSLVGPRPAIPYEVEHYPPHWFERFDVRPGLTGLWQVSGRSRLPIPDMIRLDIAYVRRRSLRLNVWILLRTVPTVLSMRGAW
jgi:lipopolysaccharide/colanic/teichoic acid biosynthesis glycosyltransferase